MNYLNSQIRLYFHKCLALSSFWHIADVKTQNYEKWQKNLFVRRLRFCTALHVMLPWLARVGFSFIFSIHISRYVSIFWLNTQWNIRKAKNHKPGTYILQAISCNNARLWLFVFWELTGSSPPPLFAVFPFHGA